MVMFLLIVALLPLVFGESMVGGTRKLTDSEIKTDTSIPKLVEFVSNNFTKEWGLNMKAGENIVLKGAERQLVAGLLYTLHLEINNADRCTVKVWEKSWINFIEITESTCKPQKRQNLPGGSYDVLIDDEIKNAASFAGDRLNAMSNSIYYDCIVDIQNTRKQVVQGMKYSMKLIMGRSSVRKNGAGLTGADFSSISGCAVSKSTQKQACDVVVFYRDWMNPKYQLGKDFNCVNIEFKDIVLNEVDKLVKTEGKDKKTKTLLGADGHDECHGGMFADFKQKYEKTYATEKEEYKRFDIFCKNVKKARKIQETEQGSGRYGVTMFSDMTEEEFSRYRNGGVKWDLSATEDMKQAVIPNVKVPDDFDWRSYNAVTPVKNQGPCGSCWAFSTTGNIEGQWKIKKTKLVSLSEQELVDCDKVDDGCDGGLPSNAYKEIVRLGGLENEHDYQYEGDDEKCHFAKSKVKVYINSSVAISKDEDEMAAWLFKNGPISIGINANVMQFYWGGISYPWKIFCEPSSLDHGVLIVGFGKKGSEPYWIVKNSWGPSWGEKGYYLVYRGASVCGLNQMCTSAVVD